MNGFVLSMTYFPYLIKCCNSDIVKKHEYKISTISSPFMANTLKQ